MAWKQALGSFLRSAPILSMIGGACATGFYVAYKDYSRHNRMINIYKCGNILPPLAENEYELAYFHRIQEENKLKRMFHSDFTNEYYLINGDVGAGKTRMIIEVVRELMSTSGAKKMGAPIFVTAAQGKSFPETLAEAVKFYFDEHISFSFFLDFLLRIESFPKKDNDSKLIRVLDAIEKSSFLYMLKTGRPVVLIIDGINNLERHMPGALQKLQDKSKLWADANTVKVVFVNNDEATEALMQKNASSWSRAANPMLIDDLSNEDAIKFLTFERLWETLIDGSSYCDKSMTTSEAEKVVELVGGRILDLLTFKRAYSLGIPIDVISEQVKDREREKFIQVSRFPSTWCVISALRNAPNKTLKLSKLIKSTSQKDVEILISHNIIRSDSELGFVFYINVT